LARLRYGEPEAHEEDASLAWRVSVILPRGGAAWNLWSGVI
jgi:hypothetical protein